MPEKMQINVYTYEELDSEARRKFRLQMFTNARRGPLLDDEGIRDALQISEAYPEGRTFNDISKAVTERLYYYFSEEYVHDCEASMRGKIKALEDGTLLDEVGLGDG